VKSIWLYRGIPKSKRVWSGDPNGKSVKAPEEEEYYDLIELADDDNCHVGYKWEKSQYIHPEVQYGMSWYPVPATYWS